MKRPPSFLFRYRPPCEITNGYLKELLCGNHIYASSPRGFQDEYDCQAQIDFNISETEWLRNWRQQLQRLGLSGQALSHAAHEPIATGAWKDPGNHAGISQRIQDTLNNSGIICLTDSVLCQRMWDEYAFAEGHHGICLCFDSTEMPLASEVSYVPELPAVKLNVDVEDYFKAFLLTKRLSYSWEREWRCVDYNKGDGYKPISPSALRALVFGSKTSEEMKQEVRSLVSHWKPNVTLFAVDALKGKDPGLRLQLLDEPRASSMAPIIPPIQEHSRNEPVWRSHPVRMLDYLSSVSQEHRRRDLDSRIECLASRLKTVESSQGRLGKDAAAVAAVAVAAVQEATDLVRELVDRSGAAAIPGYGEVSVLLYQLVYAMRYEGGAH